MHRGLEGRPIQLGEAGVEVYGTLSALSGHCFRKFAKTVWCGSGVGLAVGQLSWQLGRKWGHKVRSDAKVTDPGYLGGSVG